MKFDSKDVSYIAFSDGDDSGACVLDNTGRIKYAFNEERLNRIKLYYGSPKHCINLSRKEFDLNKVKGTVIPSYSTFGVVSSNFTSDYYTGTGLRHKLLTLPCMHLPVNLLRIFQYIKGRYKRNFLEYYAKEGFKRFNIVDHHVSHGAAAYFTSGLNKALIITMDGQGDTKSALIAIGKGRNIKVVKTFFWGSCIAHLYARMTQYLGFKYHRHEGKITGLAAYGDYTKLYEIMSKWVWYEKGRIHAKPWLRMGFQKKRFDKYLSGYSREDIAATLQKISENVTVKWVRHWVKKLKLYDIVLSGGVFANVKINQRIHEIPEVKSVYIFPHMGDGGLATGAALAVVKPIPYKLPHVFLGLSYTDEEIEEELKKYRLKYKKFKKIEEKIAKLLAKGKVVARFNGAMEYGPRALGNRSILYQTTDPAVNDWLNKRLERTEFMPFAPSTLAEYADKCYKNIKGAEHAATFMTICFDCTDWMMKNCPAVVHVDGTARPHLVHKETNPSYYKIVDEYRKLTGLPSILNTSFNMHEEPMVCSPYDAVRAFLMGNLDYLAIGNYLLKFEDNKDIKLN